MIVKVSDSVHRIDYKKYYISLFYCQLHLLVDFRFKYIFGVYYPSAGIDN